MKLTKEAEVLLELDGYKRGNIFYAHSNCCSCADISISPCKGNIEVYVMSSENYYYLLCERHAKDYHEKLLKY